MKSKAGMFLEYLWLLIAAISLIAGIQQLYSGSLKNGGIFTVMIFVALLMYSFRRNLRKKAKDQNDK